MDRASSDSVKSKGVEDEKNVGDVGGRHETAPGGSLPDPDAGLSEEERARIVRAMQPRLWTEIDKKCRIRNSCEGWTSC
jgi:hypothetical protein